MRTTKFKFISDNCKFEKLTSNYDVYVIDNFLQKKSLQSVINNWPKEDSPEWVGGYEKINGKKNILETGLKAINDRSHMPSKILDVYDYFHTKEFTNFISQITGDDF